MRPGFLTGDSGRQMMSGYVEQFRLVRAIEVLLGWQNAPNISPADIIYAAHQAGADVNRVLA